MRLFIAEKPSLARAIAQALPPPHRRSKTHIACGEGNVVAWCAGHILESAPPEAYAAHHKQWRLGDLPIVPRPWKLEVRVPELLDAIRCLLKGADRVVHAGDPDREGQLLVDEVLDFLGYRGPVERLLVRDLTPDAVRRQLAALEPNRRYRPLYESALARQRADWLFGMNMTRLYTLLGRAAGYDGVLSVGRVQTPVLGLVVARDRAIAEFQPTPYFALAVTLRTDAGEAFHATWAAGPAAESHLDDEKRLLRRDLAESVAARLSGQRGSVTARTDEKKTEAPPLPYALADLQMDAGRRLGMTAQAVLDTCQSLYETHRLITYPRSDSAYLPEAHHAQARDVLAAVVAHAPALAAATAGANLSRRTKAWNDRKITAHHAIIPTPDGGGRAATLSGAERAIYELIARRYIAQFYGPHESVQTRVEVDVASEHLVSTARHVATGGWKDLFAKGPDPGAEADGGAEDPTARLPRLRPGDAVTAQEASVTDKQTEPPKPFTDATLIAAMCGVAKFVRDPEIKKVLTETDGIGTPATRAAILETLCARRYVTRVGKSIVSTETGRALIGALPEVATTPDLTAIWEAAMRAILEGRESLDAFLARVCAQLRELVAQGRALGRIVVAAAAPDQPPPKPPRPGHTRRHPTPPRRAEPPRRKTNPVDHPKGPRP